MAYSIRRTKIFRYLCSEAMIDWIGYPILLGSDD